MQEVLSFISRVFSTNISSFDFNGHNLQVEVFHIYEIS
jgi:hypothetical protein